MPHLRSSIALLCCLLALVTLAGPAGAADAKPASATDKAKDKDPGIAARKAHLENVLQHFNLGVCASVEYLDETRDKNGAKWMFRQQYVSGGAGWDDKRQTWDTVFLFDWNKYVNPDKKRGVWLDTWVKATVDHGYIPWITMYNLAQSFPADYKPGPPQATPANAKNVETMRSYWEQVKLMMQICGKYPDKPMVVQVEPDEWGHLLIAGGMQPTKVDVKVGSSGLEELKGLPDDLIGYASAWTRLRARYAPMNVLMCCNLSEWDAKGTMSAANWARYMIECGVDKWDLAVAQFSDFDLGAQGKKPPYAPDRTMFAYFDSFEEQLKFVEDFHKATGLWIFYWQVAVGNTWFLCENQTPGHFTDCIPQFLLEDYPRNTTIARYVQAGCAGFIFNSGGMHSTSVDDSEKDGITNPPPTPGNLGHKSEYPDDDGGYMRLRCANYYKNPYPILGKSKAKGAADKQDQGAPAETPSATKELAAKAPPETFATYRDILKERLSAEIAGGRHPRFAYSAIRQDVVVEGLEKGVYSLKMVDGGSMLTVELFKDLKPEDGKAIALAVVRSNHAEDHALAAFFALAAGDQREGRNQLGQAGEQAAAIEAIFAANDPAAPPAKPAAKPAANVPDDAKAAAPESR